MKAEWRKRIAMALANDTAVAYGKTLSEEEMRSLLRDLFALPAYRYTADGKRVLDLLTNEEIQKRI